MGRHIVISFGCVPKKRISIRDQSGEESLQVAADFQIGVFLDQQGSGCMAQMDCHQTTLEPRFSDKCGHSIGEFIESAALSCDQQFFKSLTKHNDRVWLAGRFL
jgi:hypothetical protein